MNIVKRLNQDERDELAGRYKDHPLFKTHVGLIPTASQTYTVKVSLEDLSGLFIYPCLPKHGNPYQTVLYTVKYIYEHPEFLKSSDEIDKNKGTWSGRLSGRVVSKYINGFIMAGNAQKRLDLLGDIFVLDSKVRNQEEVLDGQHRLVAYSVVGYQRSEYFPINVYFGVNRPIGEIGYLNA